MSADARAAVPPVPVGSLVPIGSIIAFAGNADDPMVRDDLRNEGWLVCDGSWVNQDTYPFLFNRIGTLYGTGGPASQFKLPDYRGRFLRGVSGDSGRDPDVDIRTPSGGGTRAGVASYQPQGTAQPPALSVQPAGGHSHIGPGTHKHLAAQYQWANHNPTEQAQVVVAVVDATQYPPSYSANQSSFTTGTDGGHDHGPADNHRHEVYGFDNESRPINIYVYWLIKYA